MMIQLPPESSSFLRYLFNKITNGSLSQTELDQYKALILDYYSSLNESKAGMIFILSSKGKITSGNVETIHRLLGHPCKDTTDLQTHISEGDYLALDLSFHQALNGFIQQEDITLYDMQEQPTLMTAIFSPLKVKNQPVTSVFMFLEEVPPENKLESLYQLENKNALTPNQPTDIGSFQYLINQDIADCSNKFYTIFGIDPTSTISLDVLLARVNQDDYEKVCRLLKEAMQYGRNYEVEYRIYLPSENKEKYIREYVEVISKDGKPDRLIGIVKDISDDKKMETHLLETNERFRHIFDHLDVGFWMTDADNGKVTHASKGLARILHIPIKSLYDHPVQWKHQVLPEHEEAYNDANQALMNGESVDHMFRIYTEEGIPKWVYEQAERLPIILVW